MTRVVPFAMTVVYALTVATCGSRGPTAADATAFLATVNAEMLRLGVASQQAGWVYSTFITPDTEALIMALAMSASAIHAQTTIDAAETLSALLASLRDELESTEMFITVFYGVIDPTVGVLRYANTGHPHAFVITGDGTVSRLPALDPPLGMTNDRPDGASRPWRRGSDLLLLFTDGVSDAQNDAGVRLGEQPVLEIVRQYRAEPTATILERVFDALRAHIGESPRPDDLALVIVRN